MGNDYGDDERQYLDGEPADENTFSPLERTAAIHAAGKIQFANAIDVLEIQNVLWGRNDPRTGRRSTHGAISRIEELERGLWGVVLDGTRTGGLVDDMRDLKRKASIIMWFAGIAMTAGIGAAFHAWIH